MDDSFSRGLEILVRSVHSQRLFEATVTDFEYNGKKKQSLAITFFKLNTVKVSHLLFD